MGLFKSKGRYFEIPLTVYPFTVVVSVDQSDEKLLKELDKYQKNWSEEDKERMKMRGMGRFFEIPTYNLFLIRLETHHDKYEMISLITHECFHAVSYLMKSINMELTLGTNDEAYAYLIGYINCEICKKLKI